MAVLSMITIRVKPGRNEVFLGPVRELREIEGRVGSNLRSMRLFEYDDLASWGATVDAERKDETFNAQVGGADDPAETIGQTLFVEVPF